VATVSHHSPAACLYKTPFWTHKYWRGKYPFIFACWWQKKLFRWVVLNSGNIEALPTRELFKKGERLFGSTARYGGEKKYTQADMVINYTVGIVRL
jgi:hypothetical protein